TAPYPLSHAQSGGIPSTERRRGQRLRVRSIVGQAGKPKIALLENRDRTVRSCVRIDTQPRARLREFLAAPLSAMRCRVVREPGFLCAGNPTPGQARRLPPPALVLGRRRTDGECGKSS